MKVFHSFLTVAGVDPLGGAGVEADILTASGFGMYPMSATTCVTAQNSTGLHAIQRIDPETLRAQLDAIAEEIIPSTIKTGLFVDAGQIRMFADWLRDLRTEGYETPLTIDPVLSFTAGGLDYKDNQRLLRAYVEDLLPLATVVTPNRNEFGILADACGTSENDNYEAKARLLFDKGCKAVIITGSGEEDLVITRSAQIQLPNENRIETPNHHGTGCLFSSAIACGLSQISIPSADLSNEKSPHFLDGIVAAAKQAGKFVREALRQYKDVKFGRGYGPANMFLHPFDSERITI